MTRSPLVLVAIATTVPVLAVGTAPATVKTPRWCGAAGPRDWLCTTAGTVTVSPPDGGPPTAIRATRRLRPRAILPLSQIVTSPTGRARMTFARDAVCMLGDRTTATAVVTRFTGPGWLFRQDAGVTLCTFARKPQQPLRLFCDPSGTTCPVAVDVDGNTSIQLHTSNPIIIDIYAGSVDITCDESRVEASTSGRSHWRVTIVIGTDGECSLSVAGAPVTADEQRIFELERTAVKLLRE
jgi:hypothetical protein